MEAKFTPSPWICDLYAGGGQVDVISDCGRKTLHCNKIYFGGTITDEDIANAHLIAAAPEMYEMLEEMADYDECQMFKNHIKEILAKARGEQCKP